MNMASILHHGSSNEFGSSELSRSRSRSWRKGSKWSPPPDVPKGSLAVYVGEYDEEPKRFVIPISYLRHQLLRELLKRSEEEFGFCRHEGALHLHCDVSFFCRVLSRIESESMAHHVKIPRGPIGLTVP